MTALLEARGVVKRFGGLTAVGGVDISVAAGEMVGLVGPNGSGKTTLFDCLSRVQPVDAGLIRFGGVDITGLRAHDVARLGMSRTFQIIRVYRDLSVAENMHLSIQWGALGVPELFARTDAATRCRADELLDLLLLGRLRHERAGNLSGGQRRLLEIGMSLMSEPRLVLLDEATSGVNPTLVADIADRIRAVNSEQQVAFLLVEHNVQFVADLCERVVVLDQGAVLAEGTPGEIMRDPSVIEAYFGDPGEGARDQNRVPSDPGAPDERVGEGSLHRSLAGSGDAADPDAGREEPVS
ncbi:MAG: ABC transporter ATP-binding protein [bacterium]|nr:ABC transporter ATP-binding protein [bacterium]